MMTEVVSTESISTSFHPSLAVDSAGNVHIAWYDVTDYAGAGGIDWDIFYKRTIFDSSPPEITDVTHIPSEPTQNDQITISATVTDNIEVQNVTLYFRVDGGSWHNILMTVTETFYSATIGSFAASSTIEYYIVAQDSASNSAQSSIRSFGISSIVEEFGGTVSTILITISTVAFLFVVTKIRKRNPKPN